MKAEGSALHPRLVAWCLRYQALVYGLGLVVVAGLIPDWGQWYSQSSHHRAQVEAFLRGSLALGDDPTRLEHDLTWSEGGVHQVWGLGVPLWRLPFELATRLMGAEGFPDMLALAAALGLAAWVVFRALFGGLWLGRAAAGPSPTLPDPADPGGYWSAGRIGWLSGAAALLLVFPPFVNLLQTRFDIYEEVIAYEYVLGLGLVAGLIELAQRPSRGRYWGLCALAGLGGLVRPTLVFHGAAAVVAGAWALGQSAAAEPSAEDPTGPARPGRAGRGGWLGPVAGGLGLFVFGGAVLFATNLARFGSGFEFGHKLNVQHLYGSLYATRFDHPYAREPLLSAARELFGMLFLLKEPRLWSFYGKDLFPGQSATVRWREIGLSTYDLSYLAWLLAGWAAGAVAGWRLRSRGSAGAADQPAGPDQPRVVAVLGAYSALAAAPLLGFYLRNCVIATRYLLDLMPAFAAAVLAAWLAWGRWWEGRRFKAAVWSVSGLALVGWLVWEITHARNGYGPPRVFTWGDVLERRQRLEQDPRAQLPASGCYESARAPGQTGIHFNGAGWEPDSGRLMPCAILFVDNPEFLELELAAQPTGLVPADPEQLRAKVGLEFLRREHIEPTAQGWKVRFTGPKQRRYQRGIQPVFLATVPNQFLAAYQHAPWRLDRVRWRQAPAGSGGAP